MAWMKISESLTKIPELLIQGRISFDFDGIPLSAENLSLRKRLNLLKVGFDQITRSNRAWGLPPIIQVEPSNICNLECPLCPCGSNFLERHKGLMPLRTFRQLIDELGDVLIAVYLFCFGEPFMNRELPKMVELCSSRNILTLTSTNGHFIQTLDEALTVVDAGLTVLIIAVDGSTQEIYEAYRKGGDIERVKRCIALVEEAKARRGSPFPYTTVRCVVTGDNEGDLGNIEQLASASGVNMFSCKSLGCMTQGSGFKEYEPSKDDLRRFEYAGGSRMRKERVRCPFPFRQPIVFWDGTVVGCEYDHDRHLAFGTIGLQGFRELWNSPQALKLRSSVRRGDDRPGFCRACPYQDRVQKGTHLVCKELRPSGGASGP